MSTRDAIIAAALAKPPPAPADCVLRSLDLGTPTPLALRVPAQNHIPTMHIRMAYERAGNGHANRQEYNDALQAEYSRLQDSQPWYWDQLWPGGIALARHLLSNDELVRGRTVLEFGAGIGLLACATARSGASLVAAVDIEPTALEFIRQSAADNGLPAGSVHAIQWDWDEPPPPAVVEAAGPTGRFDVVLLPDVMYDDAAVERLGVLAPSLLAQDGILMWGDGTDRTYGEEHSARMTELLAQAGLSIRSTHDLRDGASADDGGAAPDRPVRLVIAARAQES